MDRLSGRVISTDIDCENAAEPNEGDAVEVKDWKCAEPGLGLCGGGKLKLEANLCQETKCHEPKEAVNHPDHYGGKNNPYEARKVIRAWKLGFNLGNVVKYISRAGKKDPAKLIEDLKKARFYLDDEIAALEGKTE